MNDLVDKSHFKTFSHIEKVVKQRYPNASNKEIRRVLNKRLKDRRLKLNQTRPYQIKIFSSSPNCWFHDLLDNSPDGSPRYWHIFIGMNNRFAVAKPLENKSANSIKSTLTEFVNEQHPAKLTSDEEPGFLEKSVIEFLKENKVSVRTVTEKNHSVLGIIDRFIRTLRDMNTPNEKSKKESIDSKYRSFTVKRMNKLLDIYNNTFHSAIKCSPKEMFNDPEKEKSYVFRCLDRKEKQESIEDFDLKPGTFVRYILPRSDGFNKKRYQVSRECFKIDGKDGMLYTLMAQDGTVKTLPRYRLIPCKRSDCEFGSTFEGEWNGVVTEIIKYDKNKNKYQVRFKVPNKPDYIDWIPPRNLRGNWPQKVSEIEKQFGYKN